MSSTAYDDQYTYDPNVTIGAVGSTPNSANTVTINTAGTSGFVVGNGGAGAGMYMVSNVGAGSIWANANSFTGSGMSTNVLSIMAEGDGDAMIKTKKNTINLDEMAKLMDTVKERLLILAPAFEKHEQYPALKEAYDHYKLIEALCREEETK